MENDSRPQPDQPAEPRQVYIARPVVPAEQPLSDEVKRRHAISAEKYPSLNLSDAEYIISAVRRHPIGMAAPVILTVLIISFIASVLINFSIIMNALGIYAPPPFGTVLLIGLLLMAAVAVGGYISIWIYTNNRFYLTNESVIQEIQTGLFSRHEQTVSLENIEDASYYQSGIIQVLFNYGSIRLSTEGDETTYRFSYVANPKEQIATLNNAVEAFKNGRPIQYNN
ncbi:MAG TPA: PH domain-containing protein [Candidatus Saccharimonadales bacterium]